MITFFKRAFVGSMFAFVLGFSAMLVWPSLRDGFEEAVQAKIPAKIMISQAQTETPNPEPEEESLVPAQTIEQTPGPIPETSLSVQIIGPRDGVVGDQMYFSLAITGAPDSVEWSLDPPAHGFHLLDGRRNAIFSNRDDGLYEIYVSIGGDKQVAHDKFKFSLEQGQLTQVDTAQPPTQQSIPQMQQAPLMQQQMPQHNMLDWKGAMKILAVRVPSNDRRAEGITLSGCFREVANQLRVGTFSGGDPWVEVNKQAREALGASYAQWQVFFRDLGLSLLSLHQRGVPNTPDQNILLLESSAEALGDL